MISVLFASASTLIEHFSYSIGSLDKLLFFKWHNRVWWTGSLQLSLSRNDPGPDSIVRPTDNFDDRFSLFKFFLRLKLELPDELREDGLLLHHGEPLPDAVSRTSRERNVGVRMSRWSLKWSFTFIIISQSMSQVG